MDSFIALAPIGADAAPSFMCAFCFERSWNSDARVAPPRDLQPGPAGGGAASGMVRCRRSTMYDEPHDKSRCPSRLCAIGVSARRGPTGCAYRRGPRISPPVGPMPRLTLTRRDVCTVPISRYIMMKPLCAITSRYLQTRDWARSHSVLTLHHSCESWSHR